MIVEPNLVGEDQVVGLEIAVDDPLRVRVRQPRQQLPHDVQRARRRLWPLPVDARRATVFPVTKSMTR